MYETLFGEESGCMKIALDQFFSHILHVSVKDEIRENHGKNMQFFISLQTRRDPTTTIVVELGLGLLFSLHKQFQKKKKKKLCFP